MAQPWASYNPVTKGDAELEELEKLTLALAIEKSLESASNSQANFGASQNQNTPAPAGPPRRAERHAKSMERPSWPRIEEWLKKRRGPKPVVRCFACRDELVIPGLQTDDGRREPHCILACGHVVGDVCLGVWIEKATAGRGGYTKAKCPYCGDEIECIC